MVVVRRGDRFPEGPEDGNVILDTSDFAIGATVQYVDPTAPGNKYYAAFATDGTDWTSVVSEGINAAVIYTDGVPGGEMVFGNGDPLPEACGCAQSGGVAPAGSLLALTGLLAAARRRRRW